jgi:hypothetical protein
MKAERFEVFLGRTFLSMISIILIFLFLEFVSRLFISSRAPIERRFPVENVRHPQPYRMFGGKPNTGGLNEQGYRGNEALIPKSADEFRIFLLGGSTVFKGDPPISDLLEEEFKSTGYSNVKVYNFGVISSVSGMELAQIVFEISELQPDLIVMYNGGNDITHPLRWDPRPGYPFNFIVYENNPILENDIRSYPSLTLLAYGSNILRILLRSYFIEAFIPLEEVRFEAKWNSEGWKSEIVRTYVKNLTKADKISGTFGAQFITFFQPLVYFKPQLLEREKKFVGDKDFALDMRERIIAKIEEVKKNSTLKFIDLSCIYEATSEWVFTDFIHTRQASKTIVAQEMCKHIISNINMININ